MSHELHVHTHEKYLKDAEKYFNLHNKKTVRALDKIVTFMGMLGPLGAIPQVYEIWVTQDASGNALSTWLIWNLTSVFWIIYGIAHRSYPVIIIQTAWLLVQSAVILGILIY